MKYLLDGQETQRLLFRKIQKSDFNDWLAFFRSPASHEHWIEKRDSPEVECEKWYQKQFHRYQDDLGGMNALILQSTGRLIGHCGLLVQTVDQQTELEVGYSILPEYWKKGFATEAARHCIDFAFTDSSAESVISIISLTNLPSEKVARRNGMRIDKTTEYHENRVNIFRVTRAEWAGR